MVWHHWHGMTSLRPMQGRWPSYCYCSNIQRYVLLYSTHTMHSASLFHISTAQPYILLFSYLSPSLARCRHKHNLFLVSHFKWNTHNIHSSGTVRCTTVTLYVLGPLQVKGEFCILQMNRHEQRDCKQIQNQKWVSPDAMQTLCRDPQLLNVKIKLATNTITFSKP